MEPREQAELIWNDPADRIEKNTRYGMPKTNPFQKAKEIRQSKGYDQRPNQVLPGGGMLLRARVVDSFGFVDHPQVELDAAGKKVVSYACDCPSSRHDGGFCAHCAALVLGQQNVTRIKTANGSIDQDLEDWDEDALEDEFEDEYEEDEEPEEEACEDVTGPELMDLSYKFSNSHYDLYPLEREPRIPLERYIQVFGKNARAKSIYNRAGLWGGSCFGFVSTTSMFYEYDSGTEMEEFHPGASMPSEIELTDRSDKLNLTLHNYLEALQILQYGQEFYYNNSLKELADRTEAYQKGEGRPVCMAVWKNPRFEGGHAILPFRLKRTDGPEDVLEIYDPNHPRKTRFGYLEKDEAGNYKNWRFAMDDYETYASKTGGQLFLAFYDEYKKAWDNRGDKNTKNMISLKAGTAVLDQDGKLLARVTQSGVETFCDEIRPRPITGAAAGDTLLALPAGAFRVAVEDPAVSDLCVQVIGVDLSAELSTVAREAEICVDDEAKVVFVRIAESNVRYSINILNTLEEEEKETMILGVTSQEELHLLQKESALYASGLSEQTALYVNRLQQPLSSIGQLADEQQESEQERIANSATEKPQDSQE